MKTIIKWKIFIYVHCLSHQHGDFSENVHRVHLKDLLQLLCVLILRLAFMLLNIHGGEMAY